MPEQTPTPLTDRCVNLLRSLPRPYSELKDDPDFQFLHGMCWALIVRRSLEEEPTVHAAGWITRIFLPTLDEQREKLLEQLGEEFGYQILEVCVGKSTTPIRVVEEADITRVLEAASTEGGDDA